MDAKPPSTSLANLQPGLESNRDQRRRSAHNRKQLVRPRPYHFSRRTARWTEVPHRAQLDLERQCYLRVHTF